MVRKCRRCAGNGGTSMTDGVSIASHDVIFTWPALLS